MPESHERREAADKRKAANAQKIATTRAKRRRLSGGDRTWVPWVFVPLGLLGVSWLVVYYVAGFQIPGMSSLGDWNMLIGLGLIAVSFGLMTIWK